jgi:hypothetical protein
MRSLFIAYYFACLLCPIIAYEPHVCKESHETPIPVKLLTVKQQRMFYKSITDASK